MTYQQKLIEFNATPKYRKEMEFMHAIIGPTGQDKILDYGCGTGTMMEYLRDNSQANVYGYDVHYYLPEPDSFYWRQEYHFKFQKIYFMHSLAHIDDITQHLIALKTKFLDPGAMVYVLTPNAIWMSEKNNPGYIKDPTTVKHFTPKTLAELFTECGYKVVTQGQYGEELNGSHERLFLSAIL